MKATVLADSYREITSTKTGKPVIHRFQELFVQWSHEPFPRPATIYLGPETPIYQPGEYEFDIEKSLRIRNDRLEISDIVLKPVKVSNAQGGPGDGKGNRAN